MTVLGKHEYFVVADFQKKISYWTDYKTGVAFEFPSGVSMCINFGIREIEATTDTFFDIPAGATFTLEVKALNTGGRPPDEDDPAYMSKQVVFASQKSLTAQDWEAGTDQHMTFDYAAADTALNPGEYWMVLSGVLSGGELISANFGKIIIVEDGTGPQSSPAGVPPSQYSAATVDTLLALKQDINTIALNVADPRITGVSAPLHTRGYTNETPPRYFLKVDTGDNDWEQILITTNGAFLANLQLADATGLVLGNGVLGRLGREIRMGDGATTGGLATAGRPSNAYFIDQVNGNDTIASAGSITAFSTISAAFSAAVVDNPQTAYIVFAAGTYDMGGLDGYVASTASSTKFIIHFEPGAKFDNGGTVLDNTSGDLNVIKITGHFERGSVDGVTATEATTLYIGGSAPGNDPLNVDMSKFVLPFFTDTYSGHLFEITSGTVIFSNLSKRAAQNVNNAQPIRVSGGNVILRNTFIEGGGATGMGAGAVVSVQDASYLFVDGGIFNDANVAIQATSNTKIVLKDCYYYNSRTNGAIVVPSQASSPLYMVGNNYSNKALHSNTSVDLTFGTFNQVDPLPIMP